MKRLILLIPLLAMVAAAQMNCNAQNMVGTYAVSYSGWITVPMPGAAPVTVPGTILGVISIGYDGKVNGGGSVAVAPAPSTDYDVSGTIQVNSDCTGTLRLSTKPKPGGPAGTQVDRFVFHLEEKTLLTTMVSINNGYADGYPAVLGTWKRLSAQPNAASW
ncbi:MAG: hypothetical protein ABSB88_27025 [Bryobacteraceae bacterium]|jgi:hypothetical protein